jgi:cytochrome c-type biogenesis protein CcsB
MGVLILILIIATIVEKMYGTAFVADKIYSSWIFVFFWGLLSVVGLIYMIRRRFQKRIIVFLFHVSFIVILSGAFVTYLLGEQGMLHIREKETVSVFIDKDGEKLMLPFDIVLDRFQVIYYPGTPSPMDYESTLTVIHKDGKTEQGEVAMNQIFSCKGYRFYQSGYDDDGLGTTLAVSHDPYGIAVTYIGYGLLLLSIILFFIEPQSKFRRLMKSPLIRHSLTAFVLLLCFNNGANASVSADVKVLPKEVAANFGDLNVLYNNRICPLQTLAKDFTTKLYGKPGYEGFTAEQVFTGWMFYYSSWKQQPMIKIKDAETRRILGIDGRYATLDDFFSVTNEYKLESALQRIRAGEQLQGSRGIQEADEKYNILRLFYAGEMMKVFPCRIENDPQKVQWFSQGDVLPDNVGSDTWFFIRKTQDYIFEMVVKKDYEGVKYTLQKIKSYQEKEATEVLPSKFSLQVEKVYNQLDYTQFLAISCIIIGLFSFIYYGFCMASGNGIKPFISGMLCVFLWGIFAFLTAYISLRWIISGHVPLSNGYETMQFMAWGTLPIAFFLHKRVPVSLSFGFLICGLTLMVSVMGESSPQITPLMPVLSSPLLSIHVAVIMMAYSLFAFMMLNGIMAVSMAFFGKDTADRGRQVERLQILSQIMLYPALFCLIIGIFIGAVWANISWGRYWGWDPKEVWALITMLIYSMAVHSDSLPWFRRPLFFHIFMIAAFLSVLITYFGVNFILGGMHSYA